MCVEFEGVCVFEFSTFVFIGRFVLDGRCVVCGLGEERWVWSEAFG